MNGLAALVLRWGRSREQDKEQFGYWREASKEAESVSVNSCNEKRRCFLDCSFSFLLLTTCDNRNKIDALLHFFTPYYPTPIPLYSE
jgi:hypothetical protein